MMKRQNLIRLMVVLIIVLVDPRALFGCGPFFPEIIFTHTLHPDFPLDRFARGELGVLQPEYARSYLLVAYRHLNGVAVDSNEEKALVSLWRERLLIDEEERLDKPVDEWSSERGKIAGAGKPPVISPYYTDRGNDHYYVIVNCNADAFKTAARTLRDRVKQFGADSAVVVAWAQAQDQVFANCSGDKNIPSPLAAAGSPLAVADRAYQIAAATFYSRNFDESARLFGEIAKDGTSPWRQIAPLLVARSLIRKATLSEKLDAQSLAQAEAQLKRIIDDEGLKSAHESARRLLGFVRCRLDPEQRVSELARAVMEKPGVGEFKQKVIDYTLLLDRVGADDRGLQAPAKQDDLTDWLFTFKAEGDAALERSLQRWAETSSIHWLIASLVKISAGHPQAGALISAAARVAPDSPAFSTAAYHHARLTIEAGRKDDALKKLDEILAIKTPMPASARNRFLALRMSLARNAEEFFKFAQRSPAAVSYNEDGQELPVEDGEVTSQMKPFLAGRVSFAEDSVGVMNEALPLATLKDAALGTALPPHLRRQIAVAAWTRAVLLGDDDAARELAPSLLAMVPEMNAQLDSYLTAKDGAERQDAMLYLILKFPGMRPYVDAGMGRQTAHAQIDSYRDNWWCEAAGWGDNRYNPSDSQAPPPQAPGFLSAALRAAVSEERQKLEALEIGPNYLCTRVVEWAKRSPADPRVPEALHLAVKATRYGCRDEQTRQRSKLAFDTLRKQYPNSVWAKQTKYYYGDN
jgi:hypothetical protein